MKTLSDCFVSVVAPVYNNADLLQEFIHIAIHTLQSHYTNYELILVDDGSTDESMTVISEALADYDCIHVLRMPRSFGEDVAIAAGLESAIGDYVAVMRPYAEPPELIPALVDRCRSGVDVIVGVQRHVSWRHPLVNLGKTFQAWYCRRFCGIALPPHQTKLRVMSRRVVNTLLQIRDHTRYLRFITLNLGYRTEIFAYDPVWRGQDKHPPGVYDVLAQMLELAVASSRHPLRIVTWAGGLASVLNALYSLYILGVYFFHHGTAEGWTTMSLQISVLFFFVFVILMVACEYLGQILFESRHRPLYYLLEERNSSVMIAGGQRRNLTAESPAAPEP